MGARLLCKRGEMKGTQFEVGREATIGRSRKNKIVLVSSSVSGSHARIVWDDERKTYLVEDLGSMNGTELDGVPLRRPEAMGVLHVLTFGKSLDFVFVADGAAPSPDAEKPDHDATHPPAADDFEPATVPYEVIEKRMARAKKRDRDDGADKTGETILDPDAGPLDDPSKPDPSS